MNIEYKINSATILAQATYGDQVYGSQVYSDCKQTADGCEPITTGTTTAPNTGFLGMSPDAAIASLSGALLLAIAIAGTIYIFVSRARRKKVK